MSTQADYTPDEWHTLVHAPVQASMLVIKADQGTGFTARFGVVQETKDAHTAVEKVADTAVTPLVREAAKSLLEEKSWKPLYEGSSPESVTTSLQSVASILEKKAATDEAVAYKQYVLDIAQKTASATKESGDKNTSPKEAVALQQIAGLLKLNG
ncbi:MAG: hypothetical protein OJF49_002065 [Ktedonobacterales bacterium]|jgi:hypothetical protein|nr:MAG: hypothetical protein OJF49_002065 [Ktedonobacterales bacterium]